MSKFLTTLRLSFAKVFGLRVYILFLPSSFMVDLSNNLAAKVQDDFHQLEGGAEYRPRTSDYLEHLS
jgi:hypothetical protein